MKPLLVAILLLTAATPAALAAPATPPLAPYKGHGFTISFPKDWTVVEQSSTTYLAQQDAKRTDGPQLLFLYTPAGGKTEDQLLDAFAHQIAADIKITRRAALTTTGGRFVIGDGTIDDIKARIGALAITSGGQAVICVLVAKPAEFDALGGMALAAQVASTAQPTQPAPAQPAPAPQTPRH